MEPRIMATARPITIEQPSSPASTPRVAGVVIPITRDYRDLIKAARTALPSHELAGVPIRRFVSAVCTAEVEHARRDFALIVSRLNAGALFYDDSDAHARYRLPHEVHAGAALVWLSHLQAHDGDRHGPWARWNTMDGEARRWWVRRRRELLHGLMRAAAAYRAARAALA